MPSTACLIPRCPNFAVRGGKGRCAAHRPTEEERGYGREWRAIRRFGRATAVCAYASLGDCLGSLHRDHVTPQSLGGTHAASNLRWLCARHHARFGVRVNANREGGGVATSFRPGPDTPLCKVARPQNQSLGGR